MNEMLKEKTIKLSLISNLKSIKEFFYLLLFVKTLCKGVVYEV